MKFSIVTPSFRQLPWLKRAARSVADQAGPGVDVEHIVQDAGTGAELDAWAAGASGVQLHVEEDAGMYDALNRGFARATGEVLAWLNCDEQYLPGTLSRATRVFAENPTVQLVAGDFLIVNERMELLAYRRATQPRRAMILTDHLYTFSCALFFRREVFERVKFDASLRVVGDGEWVARVLASGAKAKVLPEPLGAFVFHGQNQSVSDAARREETQVRAKLPPWMRMAGPLLRMVRHGEKLLAGAYSPPRLEYALYAGEADLTRTQFVCNRPSWRSPW